ncbi:hypothetical protein SLS60_006130 [Paraconiothyrium brasiliense]|uniref:Major facilitator superfamily (MFS) profile domain-containing protein n=1 Tax=Paraconiothyrium brasiliense TaxID=300254 RepID=A0ABR3RE40_9PLEO
MGITKGSSKAKGHTADPVLTRLVAEDTVSWARKPHLRNLYLMLVPAAIGIEITSGFDSQLINALQIVPSWITYFGHPEGSLKGIIAAAYSLGAILSLPFIPMVDDWVGRRGSIMVGSIIMIIGALIQGFSQNVTMYIFARLILGFGIPACIVAGSSLIGELGYPKERPVLTSLFNVSYFVGQIIAAGIVFGTNSIPNDWAWRVPSLLQLVPSLLQCMYFFGDLMKMIGIKDALTKQKLNVGYAAWSLVTGGVIALVVTRFKRRTLYMLCTLSLLVVYTGWTIAFKYAVTADKAGGHNGPASAASAFFIFAYQPCYNIGFNALTYTYMVEVWPYMERSRGIAVFQLFGRLAGFFTTFVNPIGLANISWKWLIVYVAWLTYEVVFVWFLFPETANRTLEELAFLFEGEEKNIRASEAVEKVVVEREENVVSQKKV